MIDLINVMLLVVIGSIAGLIGGVFFLLNKKWADTLCRFAVPVAAGVLLSTSLLHLMPESVSAIGESAFLWVGGAFLASFLFEFFFTNLHHHDHDHGHIKERKKATIPLILFGDTIHNFIDGVAIASAYLASPTLGIVVALSTFLHETPHEIADFGVMVNRGWSTKKTFIANLFSALATFPGAFLVLSLADKSDNIVGILLAISAGIFLYLGSSDFLPEISEGGNKRENFIKLGLMLVSVATIYFLSLITA